MFSYYFFSMTSSEMYPFQLADYKAHPKGFLRKRSNITAIFGEDSKKIDILEKRGRQGLIEIARMLEDKEISYFEEDDIGLDYEGYMTAWDFDKERWYTFPVKGHEWIFRFEGFENAFWTVGWVDSPKIFKVGRRGLKRVLEQLKDLKITYSESYEYC